MPAGGNVAVCIRGELGVQLTKLNFGEWITAQRVVRELNASLGVDRAAELAMLLNCLTGWARNRRSHGTARAYAATLH
jgi:hypothetical protein